MVFSMLKHLYIYLKKISHIITLHKFKFKINKMAVIWGGGAIKQLF